MMDQDLTTNFESRNLDLQIHCSYTKHNCLQLKLNHDTDLQNYVVSTQKNQNAEEGSPQNTNKGIQNIMITWTNTIKK